MVQALLSLAGAPSGHQVWLSAGPAAIRHGGKAYERYGTSAQLAAMVGAGARVRITRRVNATLGINTLFYKFDLPMPPELRLNPGSLQRGRQLDGLFHLGIGWMLGGL